MGIGDEIMAAGVARVHHAATGQRVRILRRSGKPRWFDIWNYLPWMAQPEERGEFHEIYAKDAQDLRPYIERKTDRQWIWRAYRPEVSGFVFTASEIEFARAALDAVIIEPHIKPGASPNKAWPWQRWQQLVAAAPELPWMQLGPQGTRRLDGVRHLATRDFRLAAAALAEARAAVLTEGALHHAAAAVHTPAVVIRGGFIGPLVTGYPGQVDFFEGGAWPLGCGMRVSCAHCQAAMMGITVTAVLRALRKVLSEQEVRA